MRDVLINPMGSLDGEGEFDRGEPSVHKGTTSQSVFDIMSEDVLKKKVYKFTQLNKREN